MKRLLSIEWCNTAAFVSADTSVPIVSYFLDEVMMRWTQSSISRHPGFSHLFPKGLRVIKFALMLINPPAVSCHCNHRCNLTKCIFVKEVQIPLKAAELCGFFLMIIFTFGHPALALSARGKYRNLFTTFILQPKPICRVRPASEWTRTFVFQNCYAGFARGQF